MNDTAPAQPLVGVVLRRPGRARLPLLAQAPRHLMRLEIRESGLPGYARRVNRPTFDTNYIIHGLLNAAINGPLPVDPEHNHAPRPYSIEPVRGGMIPVLGYVRDSADALRERIASFGDPEAASLIDQSTMATQLLPKAWPEYVGFSVRVSQDRVPSTQVGDGHQRGRRVMLTTEEQYLDWLQPLFLANGAEVEEAQLVSFHARSVVRCHQPNAYGIRRECRTTIPDAVLAGVLHLTDQAKFLLLLTTGVGRQKFAGYGMIKLHPLG